jgi:hypothetical protein
VEYGDVSHRADRFSFCTATHRQLPDLDWKFEPEKAELGIARRRMGRIGIRLTWRPATTSGMNRQIRSCVAAEVLRLGPYRPGNPYGDARAVWEPSRAVDRVCFDCANRSARNQRRAVALLEDQLLSWIEANRR